MKVLLIGHYPPPHGGISVHLYEARKQMDQAGVPCRVFNLDRTAPKSDQYILFRSLPQLLWVLLAHAREGWTLHLHTNGHNRKSWILAFVCGIAGQFAPAGLLTVHSGMVPGYLSGKCTQRRRMVRFACLFYDRVICVNRQIRDTFAALGLPPNRLHIRSAYLPGASETELPDAWREVLQSSTPMLTTVLFFRPEYGFEVLLSAIDQLRRLHPELGCLVMGGGGGQEEAERMIQEAGLEHAVRLIGDVPHNLCLGLIAGSDLFVRPTFQDGDSLSVREALSLSVPTVVSDVGNRPAGAILFRAGNPVDLAAKVEAVLSSPRASRTFMKPSLNSNIRSNRILEIYKVASPQGAQS